MVTLDSQRAPLLHEYAQLLGGCGCLRDNMNGEWDSVVVAAVIGCMLCRGGGMRVSVEWDEIHWQTTRVLGLIVHLAGFPAVCLLGCAFVFLVTDLYRLQPLLVFPSLAAEFTSYDVKPWKGSHLLEYDVGKR